MVGSSRGLSSKARDQKNVSFLDVILAETFLPRHNGVMLAEQAAQVQFPQPTKAICNIQKVFSGHKVVGKMEPDTINCVI